MLWYPRLPFIHVKQCNATQPILLRKSWIKNCFQRQGGRNFIRLRLISSGKSGLESSVDHRESIYSGIGQWKTNPVPRVTSYFEDCRRTFSLDYDGTSIFERDEKCIEQRQDFSVKINEIVWKLKSRILFSLRLHLRGNHFIIFIFENMERCEF